MLKNLYYELKILEIQGKSIKVYYHEYKIEPHGEIDTIERGTVTLTEVYPFIYPASRLHFRHFPVTIYMYKGLMYLAEYYGIFVHSMYTGKSYDQESWWEYSTGLLFERRGSVSGSLTYHCVLEHTTAKLIINGMVPGFPLLFLKEFLNWLFFQYREIQVILVIIVILVSVVTVVSYITERYQKRKKKNT